MKIAAALLSLTLAAAPLYAAKEPSLSHLPASVQERVREWKDDGEVKTVKTRKQPNGANHYEVLFKERGDEKIVVFAEDGTVITESDGKGGKGRGKDKEKNKAKGKKGKDNEANRSGDDSIEKADDDKPAATPQPARPTIPSTPPSTPTTTRPERPAARPVPTDSTVTRPGTSTRPGTPVRWTAPEVRYILWDQAPEAVRNAATAQQAQHGTLNKRIIRAQTTGNDTVYHIPYERATVSFSANGSVSLPANNNGGPMISIKGRNLPEPVQKSVAAAEATEGDAKSGTIYSQSQNGKTLYHVDFNDKKVIHSFAPDGTRQDPLTYWR